jgi:hypothetical protein
MSAYPMACNIAHARHIGKAIASQKQCNKNAPPSHCKLGTSPVNIAVVSGIPQLTSAGSFQCAAMTATTWSANFVQSVANGIQSVLPLEQAKMSDTLCRSA